MWPDVTRFRESESGGALWSTAGTPDRCHPEVIASPLWVDVCDGRLVSDSRTEISRYSRGMMPSPVGPPSHDCNSGEIRGS
jgi:hypothetical protein